MSLPTASALPRALQCAASQALPRIHRETTSYGDFGSGVHAYIVRAREIGAEEALLEIPDEAEHRPLCAALPLDQLPAGGRMELAFAYNRNTGIARILGDNTGRDYSTADPEEYCGTADLIGIRDARGVVIDWKTGRYAGDPATAPQLLFFALVLSRLSGVREVEGSFAYLRDNGTYYQDSALYDELDLSAFAEELRTLPHRIEAVKASVRRNEIPIVHEGTWCKHCESLPYCPAKTSLARSMSGEIVSLRDQIGSLTPAQAGAVYARAMDIMEIAEMVIAAVKDQATLCDIPLPDGFVLRQVDTRLPTKVDADIADEVLRLGFGDDVAKAAVTMAKTTTLSAITDALRSVSPRGTLATHERRVMEAIRVRGGLREAMAPKVRKVKP